MKVIEHNYDHYQKIIVRTCFFPGTVPSIMPGLIHWASKQSEKVNIIIILILSDQETGTRDVRMLNPSQEMEDLAYYRHSKSGSRTQMPKWILPMNGRISIFLGHKQTVLCFVELKNWL